MSPKHHVFIITIVLLGLSVLLIGAKPQEKPKSVRLCLAGECLGLDGSFGPSKYDPRARYYLIAGGDCDGAHMFLLLTPDYNLVKEVGYGNDIKHASLPRLYNGTGVNIGDSSQQVRKKNGTPQKSTYIGGKNKVRVYTYSTSITLPLPSAHKERRRYDYTGKYTFHHDKLRTISYTVMSAEGC